MVVFGVCVTAYGTSHGVVGLLVEGVVAGALFVLVLALGVAGG